MCTETIITRKLPGGGMHGVAQKSSSRGSCLVEACTGLHRNHHHAEFASGRRARRLHKRCTEVTVHGMIERLEEACTEVAQKPSSHGICLEEACTEVAQKPPSHGICLEEACTEVAQKGVLRSHGMIAYYGCAERCTEVARKSALRLHKTVPYCGCAKRCNVVAQKVVLRLHKIVACCGCAKRCAVAAPNSHGRDYIIFT